MESRVWYRMGRRFYWYSLIWGIGLTIALVAGCGGADATATAPPVATRTPPPAAKPIAETEPTATAADTPETVKGNEARVLDSWSSLSPDGRWRARGEAWIPAEDAEQYHMQLRIEQPYGDVVWTVLDESSALGLGYTVPTPVRWSADGQYFYYTNRPVPDGAALFVNGSDLQRADLSDGSTTELVPAVGLALALSPDANTLAYFGYGERGLVLRDIASGEERETGFVTGENETAGAIVWAPDGSALVFTVAHEFRTLSIWRMEVETGEMTTLVEASPDLNPTEGWTETGQVWLMDPQGRYASLDPDTGTISPAHEAGDLTRLSLPEPELQLQVPAGYGIVKSTEEGRRGSFVSYNFTGDMARPHLYEIQFFSEESIQRFTENCGAEASCFYGDYPDLARYQGQKTAFQETVRYGHYDLRRFGDRYYFVSNHPCVGDFCVIREYTTFLGETKVDVWIMMASADQSLEGDVLFSALWIE